MIFLFVHSCLINMDHMYSTCNVVLLDIGLNADTESEVLALPHSSYSVCQFPHSPKYWHALHCVDREIVGIGACSDCYLSLPVPALSCLCYPSRSPPSACLASLHSPLKHHHHPLMPLVKTFLLTRPLAVTLFFVTRLVQKKPVRIA